jgi:hypothetical protein
MTKTLIAPADFHKLENVLTESNCQKMIIIHGNCKALFDGRIKSFLPLGDRLLIVKKDETLILHGVIGLKPLNWQLSGAGKIEYLAKEQEFIVQSFRPKTKEHIQIIFPEIYQTTIYDAHDTASLDIYGSEQDLSDYLFNHPEIIDDDFQPTTREYETPFGFLDLRGVDKEGNIVIIEVKKRNATLADAHQLKRYVDYFKKVEKVSIRGILVAKDFSKRVSTLLEVNNLEAVAIPWQEVFPNITKRKQKTTLDKFLNTK